MVLPENCGSPIDTPKEAVSITPTFPIAGGGTNISDDPDCAPKRGVDKASANLGVTKNLSSTHEVVKCHGD